MDEISTTLDISTMFQIVKYMQQVAHLTESTIFMSLLQPAPETFDLFDDIVLGGKLQEVSPKKDQEQYWADRNILYRYILIIYFSQRYKSFHVDEKLRSELSVKNKFLVPKGELFKAA
ncbi:hypothetical protein Tco_1240082 [Tanacetum coccineum]